MYQFSDEEVDPNNRSTGTSVAYDRDNNDVEGDRAVNCLTEFAQESNSNSLNLKRTYSTQKITQISPEDVLAENKRNCHQAKKKILNLHALAPPFLPSLSLRQFSLAHMENFGATVDEADDEEVDHQLAEELQDGAISRSIKGDLDPVPLLTPPGTPRTFEINDQKVVVCEWPSNIAIDNALTAINELRPMSPTSLEKLEEESMKREDFATPTAMYEIRSRSISDVSSGLTPNFGQMNVTNRFSGL